jgi:hypothetical protein
MTQVRRISRMVAAAWLACGVFGRPAAAQDGAPRAVPCRELACVVVIDWTRAGGVGAHVPDRRYGNPAQLEETVVERLNERGFDMHGNPSQGSLRILLVPAIAKAMCDEMPGTTTDMSCRAITHVEARTEGPEALQRNVDLPSRIRNSCASDKLMPVDRLGVFIADWIIYALDGKANGERRPVARC